MTPRPMNAQLLTYSFIVGYRLGPKPMAGGRSSPESAG
jgi:hypothetical protein